MNPLPQRYLKLLARPQSSRCYDANYPGRRADVQRYLKRQLDDKFSKLAREHSYRARSAFKLIEINQRFGIVGPGSVVIDVGAAPGSWCQVLAELVFPDDDSGTPSFACPPDKKLRGASGPTVDTGDSGSGGEGGYILGIDIQPIFPLRNVDLLTRADITRPATQLEVRRRLAGRRASAVLSDMAPNPSGDNATDHERIISLCRQTFDFVSSKPLATSSFYPDSACQPALPTPILCPKGTFLCKIWDGVLKHSLRDYLQQHFSVVKSVRPDASRDNTAELFILALDFQDDRPAPPGK